MTREQVFETLKRSRLYVDFGTFPGPERIPREAVSLYNNILTSRKGSAENSIDVPIDERFKIDFNYSDLDKAVDMAKDMLVSYEKYVPYFDEYRKKVADQYGMFEKMMDTFLKDVIKNR